MAESFKVLNIKNIKGSIDPNSSKIVDIIPFSKFNCIDYLVCFDKGSSFLNKTLNLKVYRDDSSVCDQVYGRNSAPVSIEINATANGTSCELIVKNNESSAVEYSLMRTII